MITINENVLGKAYMLDKYDNLINVKYHPYGYEGDIEENSSCAYFIYKYANKPKVRDRTNALLFHYIVYCFNESEEDIWSIDPIKLIDKTSLTKLFKRIFVEFDMYNTLAGWSINISKQEVFNDLLNIIDRFKDTYTSVPDMMNYEVVDDNIEAYLALNEDYTRVRVGGRYDNDMEDCVYFRISSIGYDWGDDIMNAVMNNFSNVGYITIERDMEASKLNKSTHKIYKTKDGELINHMPIKDFIYQEHIPLVASFKPKPNIEYKVLPLIESGHNMLEMRKYLPKSIILSEYKHLMTEYNSSLITLKD
jgi:hypothetical protein